MLSKFGQIYSMKRFDGRRFDNRHTVRRFGLATLSVKLHWQY